MSPRFIINGNSSGYPSFPSSLKSLKCFWEPGCTRRRLCLVHQPGLLSTAEVGNQVCLNHYTAVPAKIWHSWKQRAKERERERDNLFKAAYARIAEGGRMYGAVEGREKAELGGPPYFEPPSPPSPPLPRKKGEPFSCLIGQKMPTVTVSLCIAR